MTKGVNGPDFKEGTTRRVDDDGYHVVETTTQSKDNQGNSIWTVNKENYIRNDREKLVHRSSSTNIYNENGKPLKSEYCIDLDNDGNNDFKNSVTFKYDEEGKLQKKETEVIDKTVKLQKTEDEVTNKTGNIRREFTISEYNKNGQLTKEETEYDYGIDGKVDTKLTKEYDENSHPVKTTSLLDTDKDGSFDLRITETSVKDDKSDNIKIICEIDYNNDGVVDETFEK